LPKELIKVLIINYVFVILTAQKFVSTKPGFFMIFSFNLALLCQPFFGPIV